MPIGDFYLQRYRLLSSRDSDNFHIVFETDYKKLCTIMNALQAQAFEINKDVLGFIKKNYDQLVESGLFMPRFLASLNVQKATDQLRMSYLDNSSLASVCNYQDLLKDFMGRIQRARYETFIINLASAYEGYRFYLPTFLDFRARIYRAGVLHFHERDLARSLIVFSDIPNENSQLDKKEDVHMVLTSAAAFHYKKFISYNDAHQWYLDQKRIFNSSEKSLIQLAVDASNPYQFISKVLCIEGGKTDPMKIPITQDASASAYQIMSFFLLDKEIAKHTNLIPAIYENNERKKRINEIYTFFLEELKVYLHNYLPANLSTRVCSRLNRKLIKVLFMPMIYGKTIISMSNDINNHFSKLLGIKECTTLATIINQLI